MLNFKIVETEDTIEAPRSPCRRFNHIYSIFLIISTKEIIEKIHEIYLNIIKKSLKRNFHGELYFVNESYQEKMEDFFDLDLYVDFYLFDIIKPKAITKKKSQMSIPNPHFSSLKRKYFFKMLEPYKKYDKYFLKEEIFINILNESVYGEYTYKEHWKYNMKQEFQKLLSMKMDDENEKAFMSILNDIYISFEKNIENNKICKENYDFFMKISKIFMHNGFFREYLKDFTPTDFFKQYHKIWWDARFKMRFYA